MFVAALDTHEVRAVISSTPSWLDRDQTLTSLVDPVIPVIMRGAGRVHWQLEPLRPSLSIPFCEGVVASDASHSNKDDPLVVLYRADCWASDHPDLRVQWLGRAV